jgi:hypothetical protein
MGGFREVIVWTDMPHFYHWPDSCFAQDDGIVLYRDRGWAYNGDRKSNCRFKPLAEQDDELSSIVWKHIMWSCAPKSANVTVDTVGAWASELLNKDRADYRTNWCLLLNSSYGSTDLKSNVHYKRFLLEVNLITRECKLLTPRVHIYGAEKCSTVDTIDITEELSSRTSYACPELD